MSLELFSFFGSASRMYFPFSKKELDAGSRAINTSFPALYPALSIAASITSTASSFDFKSGANPPSSPTAVESFFDLRILFKLWNISLPILSASLKLPAPIGIIINSCRSTLLSACSPPFSMFIIGMGRMFAFSPPIYL